MSDWILMVDDDIFNQKMASHILSTGNMRVSCLESGEEAIRFLRENRPDIILLDVHMPGMDGFDTIAAIKERKETSDIMLAMIDEDTNYQMRER